MEEAEAKAGSLSSHTRKAADSPPPPTQLAVYMPAEIPVRVGPPLPKKSKDNQGASCPCNPMVDIFDPYYLGSSYSDDEFPDPLKRGG